MSKVIAERYRRVSEMQTAGSGSARWCMVECEGKPFFLKQFLTPVYPVQPNSPLGQRQLERCLLFEQKKQRLYRAVSCVIGNTLVPVIDFFRFQGHYYAVSEAIAEGNSFAENASHLTEEQKRTVLYDLALCLQRMHMQGIIHADLKPEHVMLVHTSDGVRPRLIDVDSGFLEDSPPVSAQEIEGDPVYLAPEVFKCMIGEEKRPTAKLDVFAFGALIQWIWNGRLPVFDTGKYHYLYEAALEHDQIALDLPKEWEPVVQRMLQADPEKRPSDAEITAMFLAEPSRAAQTGAHNGLNSLMKTRW